MENCEQCKFYKPNAPKGECRFSPPLAMLGPNGAVVTVWPSVNRDGWCGQFTYPEKAHHFTLGSPQTKDKPNG